MKKVFIKFSLVVAMPLFFSCVNRQIQQIRPSTETEGVLINTDNLKPDYQNSFSVEFWIKSDIPSDKQAILVSQKEFPDASLASQKNPGWVIYATRGSWAWNMGSGKRRITHERDNGALMPINDGKWHQIAMTYNHLLKEVKLYYDGDNVAIYHVADGVGFDFTSLHPLFIGSNGSERVLNQDILPSIEEGRELLQQLVDQFTALTDKHQLEKPTDHEFASLVASPQKLFTQKAGKSKSNDPGKEVFDTGIKEIQSALNKNPYTINQNSDYMGAATVLNLYSLQNGRIHINEPMARKLTAKEQLDKPSFDIDNFTIQNKVFTPEELFKSYSKRVKSTRFPFKEKENTLIAGNWNIWHGGKHFIEGRDPFEAKKRIVEMIREEKIDVLMLQETYSAGDDMAAELGYYFATTVDWDYLNQGSNISVLSKYPIKEVYIPEEAPFMNVAVKIQISESQDMYVMSNWYGMDKFQAVYDFHEARFNESDSIPILLAGDFNAISHLDGGNRNPASVKLTENGFTDIYRLHYPDAQAYPGPTHTSGKRIDQYYYKGKGIKNTSAKMINDWKSGFPSDHYLIVGVFELNYKTR